MSLRLLLGRAGTGKTSACLEEIGNHLAAGVAGNALAAGGTGAPALILLVPEQATFQMEQALLATARGEAVADAYVLSFHRLAWRVFLETGGAARPVVGELGRRMILRALVDRQREELRLFHRVADRPGFIDRLAATVTELHAYRKDPAAVREQWEMLAAGGHGDTILGAKLHDLALIMADLDAYLSKRFTDPDDYLTLLAERLGEAGFLRGARVWVDGFSGFTPQEFNVLQALLGTAERVSVALCLDPHDEAHAGDGIDVFQLTRHTRERLEELAAEAGVPVEEPLFFTADPPSRFSFAPALANLEREFFRLPGRPLGGEVTEVCVVEAADRRAEVDAAAREILRLCREEGLRFRDIAVILRDFEPYHDLIAASFGEYGIPFFLDRRRPVGHHPLVELVRAALETVTRNWAREPVFRFLKTDLVPVSRGDVDRLENYVLEHGIRGPRWYDGEPWDYIRRFTIDEEDPGEEERAARDLERINAVRERAVSALAGFHHRLQGGRKPLPATETALALHQLLEDLDVPGTLEMWAHRALEAGDPDQAQEHRQVWKGVVDLLDQAVESLDEAVFTVEEFLRVLEAALEGLRLGLIPPGLDQVVVGSVQRSRHPNLRAALVIGANEGVFPPSPGEDVIFNDRERERLASTGFELGPTSRGRLFHEQYFTYVALTRGGERLWISYPVAGEEGRALVASPVVRRVEELLPGCVRARAGGVVDDPAAVAGERQAVSVLARLFRLLRAGEEVPPGCWDLYSVVAGRDALRKKARAVLAALVYRNEARDLPAEVAEGLAGAFVTSSVSRLESMAACPFQHFSAHLLGLRERPLHRLEAQHFGVFNHAALRLYADALEERSLDWAEVDEATAESLLGGIIDRLAPRLASEIFMSSARHRYLLERTRRTLRATVSALGEHARRGRFRPVAAEAAFGGADGLLPGLTLQLPGDRRLELRGRIDRVDAARSDDGRLYLRVVDYKSSPRSLRLKEVDSGLSLQLMVYLMVAVRGARFLPGGEAPPGEEVLPAGALYLPVHDPLVRLAAAAEEADLDRLLRRRHRADGLLLDDPAVLRMMDGGAEGGSDIIPVYFKKDGSPGSRSRVIPASGFKQLFGRVEERVRDLASASVRGRVAVSPWREGDRTACRFCVYRSVCAFDPLVEGNRYRKL